MSAVAVVTKVGLLYCAECAERLDVAGEPVYGAPHDAETCEVCAAEVRKAWRMHRMEGCT